ncbi:hypothetical protein E4198_18735 [Streptomyces sp. RKND-216]|uniref:Class IIb bacteriocin, lactobin A/cerein 7B family n=1 Tax=Streptomyces hazeniae TaxID=3075538 RepID=A0ABU2NKN4_9ACTN|nr:MULTISPECIES: hypothetical protein [unclassified Streptomyces]MDT0377549.1 hypothetical protein [Streptomyces sp. DSM 42041]THA26448.1 hypothetical protein E4198_18735 [Streptomyces sp. RKND-216]
MEQKIATFMNGQEFGSLENGFHETAPAPVMGTPVAAVATCWYVAGGVAGAGAVVGAYTWGVANG